MSDRPSKDFFEDGEDNMLKFLDEDNVSNDQSSAGVVQHGQGSTRPATDPDDFDLDRELDLDLQQAEASGIALPDDGPDVDLSMDAERNDGEQEFVTEPSAEALDHDQMKVDPPLSSEKLDAALDELLAGAGQRNFEVNQPDTESTQPQQEDVGMSGDTSSQSQTNPQSSGPPSSGPPSSGPPSSGPPSTGPRLTGPRLTGPQLVGSQLAAPQAGVFTNALPPLPEALNCYSPHMQNGTFGWGTDIFEFMRNASGKDIPAACGNMKSPRPALLRWESNRRLYTPDVMVEHTTTVAFYLTIHNPFIRIRFSHRDKGNEAKTFLDIPISLQWVKHLEVYYPWSANSIMRQRYQSYRLGTDASAIIMLQRNNAPLVQTGAPASALDEESRHLISVLKQQSKADKIYIHQTIGKQTLFVVDWLKKLEKYMNGMDFKFYYEQSPSGSFDKDWFRWDRVPTFPEWMREPAPKSRKRQAGVPVAEQMRKYFSFPSQPMFHKLSDVQNIFGIALRRERYEQVQSLRTMFEQIRLFRVNLKQSTDSGSTWYADVTMLVDRRHARIPLPFPGTMIEIDASYPAEIEGAAEPQNLNFSLRGMVSSSSPDAGHTFTVIARPVRGIDDLITFANLVPNGVEAPNVRAVLITPSIDKQIAGLNDLLNYPAHDDPAAVNMLDLVLGHGLGHDSTVEEEPRLPFEANLPEASDEEARRRGNFVQRIGSSYSLDESQMELLEASFDTQKGVLLVQGPGGTGKSRVSSLIIVLSAILGVNILVSAPSNSACNNILRAVHNCLESLMDIAGDDKDLLEEVREKIVRFTSPAQTTTELRNRSMETQELRAVDVVDSIDSVLDPSLSGLGQYTIAHRILRRARSDPGRWSWFLDSTNSLRKGRTLTSEELRRYNNEVDEITGNTLADAKIVICTLNTCGNGILRANFRPHTLLVDEAGHALEPDMYLAMFGFPSIKRLIMMGDSKQLPPFVMSAGNNEYSEQLRLSLFSRLWDSLSFYPLGHLRYVYRQPEALFGFPSRAFYGGTLLPTDVGEASNPVAETCEEFESQQGILGGIAVDVAGQARISFNVTGYSHAEHNSSKCNYAEGNFTVELVNQLLGFQPTNEEARKLIPSDIVVLVPYAAQRAYIAGALRRRPNRAPGSEDVVVTTIDRFQGSESPIVILGLVVADRENPEMIGFTGDSQRICVGLGRPRYRLYITANFRRLFQGQPKLNNSFKHFKDLLDDIKDQGIVDVPERLAPPNAWFEKIEVKEKNPASRKRQRSPSQQDGGEKRRTAPRTTLNIRFGSKSRTDEKKSGSNPTAVDSTSTAVPAVPKVPASPAPTSGSHGLPPRPPSRSPADNGRRGASSRPVVPSNPDQGHIREVMSRINARMGDENVRMYLMASPAYIQLLQAQLTNDRARVDELAEALEEEIDNGMDTGAG